MIIHIFHKIMRISLHFILKEKFQFEFTTSMIYLYKRLPFTYNKYYN